MRFLSALMLVSAVCLMSPAPLEAQCAMCRTALQSSEQGRVAAQQFNRGILFLLGAPFSVAAGIGFAMARSRRRIPVL